MTLACPDFCSTSYPVWYSSDRLLSRSPRISTLTFPTQLHHLQWPLNHLASSSCANSPSAYASYDVLVHQLAVLRPASFKPLLTDQPLPFASSYRLITTWFSTVILLQRTFTSLVNAHVGRTQGKSRGCQNRRFALVLPPVFATLKASSGRQLPNIRSQIPGIPQWLLLSHLLTL